MAGTSVKVNDDIYEKVVEHTQEVGSKIGKFFEIAAQEKLQRDQEKENVVLQRYGKNKETK